MSKSVNVDFVTRQIEVGTDGKEYYVSAAMAAKNAEQSMLNAEDSMLSAQNAANAAEAVAPEYAKTKEVLDNIVSYTNTATEQASIATAKANAANTSATNAAQSYANADAIAAQLTEYLATKETLTAPAVDKTLLIDGAAADAKATGELKVALNDIGVVAEISELPINTTFGKFIAGDGSIGDAGTNQGVIVANVIVGKKYYISASANFTMPYYAFYDDDMQIVQIGKLSASGSEITSIVDEEVECPSGATKVVISQHRTSQAASIKTFNKYYLPNLDNGLNQLDAVVANLGGFIDKPTNVSLDVTYGYYINGPGAISSAGTNYYISKGSVIGGESYHITASTNFSNPFYAWYDDNDQLISIGELAQAGSNFSSLVDVLVVAPPKASTIIINGNTASEKACLKYIVNKLAGKWYGLKWVCVGDSLTANNNFTETHYFDYISNKTDITVVNMGDSGTGYARASDTNRAFYQRILSCPTDADVVTIFGSFNDLGAGLPTGTYTDTGTDTIAGCINTTLDNLQTIIPTVVVGVVAPTPWMNTRPTPNSAGDIYVNLLKAICEYRSIPFLDLYRESNLRPWDADFRTLCYSNDNGNGTHPNDLGHKILAPKFEAFLDKLLLH